MVSGVLTITFEKACFILSVLGAVLVLEGIPYFGFPAQVRRWGSFLKRTPEGRLRAIGLVITALGLLLLYSLRYI